MPTDSDVIESIILRALQGMLAIGVFAVLEIIQYVITRSLLI